MPLLVLISYKSHLASDMVSVWWTIIQSIHLPLCYILLLFCFLQDGQTALHCGARRGHLNVCGLLLKAGALADAQDKVWESILNFHQIILFNLLKYS